jgi:tetratricopeptide (TPR) repeat protein
MVRLRQWGRRVPLSVLVLVVPTVVTALALHWSVMQSVAHGVPDWTWLKSLTVPGSALIFIGTALGTLLVTRVIARRSPEGPLSVATIVDTTPAGQEVAAIGEPPGEDAPAPTARARTVEAILRERLATAGTEPRGLIPAAGALQLTAEQPVAATSEDAYGLLAKLGIGAWQGATQRLGWRVSGTLLATDDPANPFGLALVVEHVATGRHVFTRTVWGASPEKVARTAAYEVAAWRFLRLAPPSTRSRLHWRPTARSLRDYEEAAYCAAGNRFDEAVHRATRGLAADPSNHALRRLLGEAYEWLGHFESALRTYASGIAMVHDDQNGWTASELSARRSGGKEWASRVPAYPNWPQTGRVPARRSKQSVSDGLIWRYIVMLQFADQWVDRWISALERHEEVERELARHPGESRWAGPWISPDHRRLISLTRAHERHRNAPPRDEEARRLRGFFRQRYRRLLAEEYPLLMTMWFGELHERREHFREAARVTSARPLSELLQSEYERIPQRRGAGLHQRRIRPHDGARRDLAAWVGELQWLFRDVLEGLLPDQVDAPRHQASPGLPPASPPAVAVETLRRLGLPQRAGELAGVAAALTDEAQWRRVRLSRQLVGAVASWAAHHILQLTDGTVLDDLSRARLLALSEQLDLRAFFYRATLYELDRPARRVIPRGVSPLSRTLKDLFWLTARFHYLQRLHHLAGQDFEQPELRALGEDTATYARRITVRRAWLSRIRPVSDEWSLWYYAACVQAVVIPPAPEPGPDRVAWREALARWVRRNDTFAEFGVRALNQAILVRGRKGVTLIEAGARDWMLRRDPDLENLRRHPRFQRWVSATFSITQPDVEDGDAEAGELGPIAAVLRREWNNEGVYGAEPRWTRWTRGWCAINDSYLVERVTDLALMIAGRWRQLAACDQPDRTLQWERQVAEQMTRDVEAWRHLAGYRLFAGDPVFRYTAMETLVKATGHRTMQAPFPSRIDPPPRMHLVDYAALDEVLEPLVDLAEQSSDSLGSIPGAAAQLWRLRLPRRSTAVDLHKTCEDAANRWELLLDFLAPGGSAGGPSAGDDRTLDLTTLTEYDSATSTG